MDLPPPQPVMMTRAIVVARNRGNRLFAGIIFYLALMEEL
jgi:hypothetical protein